MPTPVDPSSSQPAGLPAPAPQQKLLFGREVEEVESCTPTSLVGRVAEGAKTVAAAGGFVGACLATFAIPPIGLAVFGTRLVKQAKDSTVKHAKQTWHGERNVVQYRSGIAVDRTVSFDKLSPERSTQLHEAENKKKELSKKLSGKENELKSKELEIATAKSEHAPKADINQFKKEVKTLRKEIKQIKKDQEVFERDAKLLFLHPKTSFTENLPQHKEIFQQHEKPLADKFANLETKREDYAQKQLKLEEFNEDLKSIPPKNLKPIREMLSELKKLHTLYEKGSETEVQVEVISGKITSISSNDANHIRTGSKKDVEETIEYLNGQLNAEAETKREIRTLEKEMKTLGEEIEEDYAALRSGVEELSKGAKNKAKIDGYRALVDKGASPEEKLNFIQKLGHRNYDPAIRQSLADYVRRPEIRAQLSKSDNHLYLVDTEKGGFIFIPNGLDANANWDDDICFMRAYDKETGGTIHDSEKLSRLARGFGTAHGGIEEWKQEMADKANEGRLTQGLPPLTKKDFDIPEFILDFKNNQCYALRNGYNPDISLDGQGTPIKLEKEAWDRIHKFLGDKVEDTEKLREKAFPDKLPPSTPSLPPGLQ